MLRPDEMIIPEESRGQGPVAEQVPERPALAPDVELIGPMPETGFTDQQWLVRQGNRFLQFTELLYALLQEINGERTLDEIAVTLAMTVLAAIFHELGHAAALRHGGGRVRGIGVGLYLVYPTFYTDVTDAYRLGRRARLRTDLGGIYFHLIFGLLVIALYFLSGREALLPVVLVITADVLYQFVPFVRADGYWALADLTGIPDLFSHVAPFLRSLVPASRRPPGPVSRLRPWVKVIFAIYVALTIPVLPVFGLLIFRGVPRFFTTTLDSLLYQERVFATALSSGDIVMMAAIGSQAVLLALSMLATVYVMYTLSRPPLRALWNWSRPTPMRTMAGALTVAGAGA